MWQCLTGDGCHFVRCRVKAGRNTGSLALFRQTVPDVRIQENAVSHTASEETDLTQGRNKHKWEVQIRLYS